MNTTLLKVFTAVTTREKLEAFFTSPAFESLANYINY